MEFLKKYRFWGGFFALFCLVLAGGALTAFTPYLPSSASSPSSFSAPFLPKSNSPDSAVKLKVEEAYGHLPLYFEAGVGQAPPQVKFLARGAGYSLFITPRDATLVLSRSQKEVQGPELGFKNLKFEGSKVKKLLTSHSQAVRMVLKGANRKAPVEGFERMSGISNYLSGSDPSRWRVNVPQFAKVGLKGIYPGVDMVYYGNQRKLEYDFLVSPGADPSAIKLKFEGADRLKVNEKGDLVVGIGEGEVVFKAPEVYQEKKAGDLRPGESKLEKLPASSAKRLTVVSGSYLLSGKDEVGFRIGDYDHSSPLVIDPQLDYSTFVGGGDSEYSYGIAVDASGDAYITGTTVSSNFPTTVGAYKTTINGDPGIFDVFVTKLNPTGTALVYSTYINGGTYSDAGQAIAVDASNYAYITGYAGSPWYPTTAGAFQTTNKGTYNAFVTKLNTTGSGLVYSTFLGGSNDNEGQGIALDGSGNAYVTGYTNATNFPTTAGAYKGTNSGGYDGFATKVNTTGTALSYSTYLGGSGADYGYSVAVDGSGYAYVTGRTASTNYPTTAGAYQTAYQGGGNDAFLTKLNAAGTGLLYSTYLGGSGDDQGQGVAVDGSGNAYLTGSTASTNYPTTAGAYQTASQGGGDAFVTKINTTGSGMVYSTYLGGSGGDVGGGQFAGSGIAIDASGAAYVTG